MYSRDMDFWFFKGNLETYIWISSSYWNRDILCIQVVCLLIVILYGAFVILDACIVRSPPYVPLKHAFSSHGSAKPRFFVEPELKAWVLLQKRDYVLTFL